MFGPNAQWHLSCRAKWKIEYMESFCCCIWSQTTSDSPLIPLVSLSLPLNTQVVEAIISHLSSCQSDCLGNDSPCGQLDTLNIRDTTVTTGSLRGSVTQFLAHNSEYSFHAPRWTTSCSKVGVTMKITQKQAMFFSAAECCLLSQAVCFLAMCLFPLTAGWSSCEEKESGKVKES